MITQLKTGLFTFLYRTCYILDCRMLLQFNVQQKIVLN